MKTRFFAYVGLAVLCGCASQPRAALEQLPDPQKIQTIFDSQLKPPVSGTFTVSYSPRDFAEPADVRKARDRFITSRIILALTRAGMTYEDFKDPGAVEADYDVRYSYSTTPSTAPLGTAFDERGQVYMREASGFSQDFSVTIDKNPSGSLWHPTPGARMPLDKDIAGATGMKSVPWDNDWQQWSGDAHIDCSPDREITDLFPELIHAVLDGFPRSE